MNGAAVAAPVVLPLLAAAVVMVAYRSPRAQRVAGVAGALALFAAALALFASVWRNGALTLHVGSWPAPFAITLVADTLAGVMVLVASLIGAKGLGEDVLEALQYANVGQGILAGFAILFCAMILDRIVQGGRR